MTSILEVTPVTQRNHELLVDKLHMGWLECLSGKPNNSSQSSTDDEMSTVETKE